jgi:hypothetical protein
MSTIPINDTRVWSFTEIDCIRSECMSDGICMDEDMMWRRTGYGCPTLCRHSVHVSSSSSAVLHVCRIFMFCLSLLPTKFVLRLKQYSALLSECVIMCLYSLTNTSSLYIYICWCIYLYICMNTHNTAYVSWVIPSAGVTCLHMEGSIQISQ